MMKKNDAKKAVKKAKTRKQQAGPRTAELEAALQLAQQAQLIDPEIQAEMVDMQPADGYVNPYHAMGSMAPMMYAAGNMLDGYNYPVMVNPEA